MKFDPQDADETAAPSAAYPTNWWLGMDGLPGTGDEAPKYNSDILSLMGGGGEPSDWNVATGNFGPHCRNCHRGSSDCAVCHESSTELGKGSAYKDISDPVQLASAIENHEEGGRGSAFDSLGNTMTNWRNEQTVYWDANWRTSSATTADTDVDVPFGDPKIDTACSNDGFSWPHRTMGFKLLKDELWGLDFDGTEVWVGEHRDGAPDDLVISGGIATTMTTSSEELPALYAQDDNPATPYVDETARVQDLDSVCLDCHNPDVWNVKDMGDPNDLWNRLDRPGTLEDNYNDELILRGLP